LSRLKQKTQRAREKGCWVFREHWAEGKPWAVYVEGEWEPRYDLTHREAVNLAYAISISKKIELEVTFD
jgi:hypothetical protein